MRPGRPRTLMSPTWCQFTTSARLTDACMLTMRLIEGRDLQALLADGALVPHRAVAVIEQIASALHAAHRIGLVHRDVKPSNILIAEDDFAYLIDFGIARAAGETGVTSTGATIGTWEYMAPERFQEGIADARADIYSLTCVLYQTLTGQFPFPSKSLEQLATAHMLKPPPRPSELKGDVPPEMDEVIATGMAKDPAQRYPTTRDLAQAARAVLTSSVRQSSQTRALDATSALTLTPPADIATQAGTHRQRFQCTDTAGVADFRWEGTRSRRLTDRKSD